ncbi:MAG: adenylosuccinate lyase [Clostridia bacterium]|nr:adenylosuccinate lyase [Deltaproteobacteria bacterium]
MISRYETEAMRNIWGNQAQLDRWTKVEVAACETFALRGDIPADEMKQIRDKSTPPTPERVREIENTTNHDVVAFVRALGENIGEPASRHLHRGLTSSDVVDTALAMAVSESLEVLIESVKELANVVARRAREHKMTPCVGRTHGIHAEPTTYGLRLAGWYAELQRHLERLRVARMEAAHGKLSGAVGTFSQTDPDFERHVLAQLDLWAEPIATQVIPRDRHAFVFSILAILGSGLERFAVDVRGGQRTEVREVEEPFSKGQTGSSAMPHKRNPITSERIVGMARLLRGYMVAGVEDVALWYERDISHSSVERVAFPDAFHLAHYMVLKFAELVDGMRVYPERMKQNLDATKGLVFSQNVLGALLKAGLDRHVAYASVQRAAMRVWEGESHNFKIALADEEAIKKLPSEALDDAFSLTPYFRHVDALFARAGITDR